MWLFGVGYGWTFMCELIGGIILNDVPIFNQYSNLINVPTFNSTSSGASILAYACLLNRGELI